jgi:hypothetical protein
VFGLTLSPAAGVVKKNEENVCERVRGQNQRPEASLGRNRNWIGLKSDRTVF